MLRAFAFSKPPFAAMQMDDGSRILALDALTSSTQCCGGFGRDVPLSLTRTPPSDVGEVGPGVPGMLYVQLVEAVLPNPSIYRQLDPE